MACVKELCVLCGDGSGGGGRTAFEEMCEACQEGKCSSCTEPLDCDDDDRCAQCINDWLEAGREDALEERAQLRRGWQS